MKRIAAFAEASSRASGSAASHFDGMRPAGRSVLGASPVNCIEQEGSRYGKHNKRVAARRWFCWERDGQGGAIIAAETPGQRFSVLCKNCGRRLAQTTRIRDTEIAVVEEHVSRCFLPAVLSDKPRLGELLTHVRVISDDPSSCG